MAEEMKKLTEESRFEYLSENLYESSYLIAKSFKVLGFIKQGRKVGVRFLKTPELEEASMTYFNGGLIAAIKFTDAYRRLKDSVFTAVRNDEDSNRDFPSRA